MGDRTPDSPAGNFKMSDVRCPEDIQGPDMFGVRCPVNIQGMDMSGVRYPEKNSFPVAYYRTPNNTTGQGNVQCPVEI